MREIKFRYWNGDYIFKSETLKPSEELFVDPDVIEIMQYTGLKDKNGKEIYEGDIVIGHPYCFEPVVVYWDRGQCGWEVKEANGNVYAHFIDWSGEGDLGYQPLEVIGNIYENPEFKEDK